MGLDQSLRIKEIDGRLVTTRKHKHTVLRALTQRDIEVLTDLFAVLKGVYGEGAKAYFRQYIRLYRHYRSLKDAGVKVRVSPLRLGSTPLLIIDR